MGLDRNELAARFAVALAGREGCAPTVAASEAVAYTDALLAALSPAPVPAATVPTPYAPRVGDVVGIDGGKEYGETRVVTGLDGDRVSYVRLNTKGDVLCRHTMESSLLTYLRPATAAERAAAGLSVDEAKPSAAPAETPALEHRRTVGAVVRGSQFGRRFIVIRSGDTDGAQRELPHPNARPVGAWPTDEFDGWATKEECDRHGVPFVDRSVDRTTPAAALTEEERADLRDAIWKERTAWLATGADQRSEPDVYANAAAAWFAKRDGTVKP